MGWSKDIPVAAGTETIVARAGWMIICLRTFLSRQELKQEFSSPAFSYLSKDIPVAAGTETGFAIIYSHILSV
jgi:hypothetical protein